MFSLNVELLVCFGPSPSAERLRRPPPPRHPPPTRVQLPRTAVSPAFDLITLGTEKVPGLVGQNWDLRVQCQLWI